MLCERATALRYTYIDYLVHFQGKIGIVCLWEKKVMPKILEPRKYDSKCKKIIEEKAPTITIMNVYYI
jgi:hypothetical protein